jgi:hypothetical protein
MFKEGIIDDLDGAPLAVCINDCEIDRGHSYSELAKICFQVGCAFAEMRWGRMTDKNQGFKILPPPQTYQILSIKAQR